MPLRFSPRLGLFGFAFWHIEHFFLHFALENVHLEHVHSPLASPPESGGSSSASAEEGPVEAVEGMRLATGAPNASEVLGSTLEGAAGSAYAYTRSAYAIGSEEVAADSAEATSGVSSRLSGSGGTDTAGGPAAAFAAARVALKRRLAEAETRLAAGAASGAAGAGTGAGAGAGAGAGVVVVLARPA